MSIFNIISLLGGLAMFLYGMRLLGDHLKESSSGALKSAIEKVTNNPVKAFLLGVLVTAIIQSSTATIVITSGLVAAEIITLHQSLGIILGANVGTTITGQIIRLLDVDAGGTSWLNLFKPSTLAPLALIVGVLCVMFIKFNKSNTIGNILIGFGILFSGLMNMTNSVSVLSEGGMLDGLFQSLGDNMWMGYLVGAAVAFVLQSASASIGILQAFALAGSIPFKTAYIIILGVYLGDCLTTGIVCWIGAKPNSKRVGIVNILFNLAQTIIIIVVVMILQSTGVLGGLWDMKMTSGSVANTNTIFKLACAILLLPVIGLFEKLSFKIVKQKNTEKNQYAEMLDALNPVFFPTPALAFNACYDVLRTMLSLSMNSVKKAMQLTHKFDQKVFDEISRDEESIDMLTDHVGEYLVELSPYINEPDHLKILTQYNKAVNDFERLGDHAMNLAESAKSMAEDKISFSGEAYSELVITYELLERIFKFTTEAFEKRDMDAAKHIEPLEDVMDDLVNTFHDNHLTRLRSGGCTINGGIAFLDILTNIERISDMCSNIGIAVVARINPELATLAHDYVTSLHNGKDDEFTGEYNAAHDEFFSKISKKVAAGR